jgi:single-strand DNA-binding protein
MPHLNKAFLIGHLGRDPETNHTSSGETIANFSVATSETWKDKQGEKQEKTTWHNIVAFGKLGDICAQYLKKGASVFIEGRIDIQDYDAKDGTKKKAIKIIASQMQMLGGKGDGERAERPAKPAREPAKAEADFIDDIPF